MTYHQAIRANHCPTLDYVRSFLRDNGVKLAKSVEQLGGPGARTKVVLLCEAVNHCRHLTQAQSADLMEFHRILTLFYVGDPDRIESALFATIDLESPFVDDCCLLSEGLWSLLRLIAENDPFTQALCQEDDVLCDFA